MIDTQKTRAAIVAAAKNPRLAPLRTCRYVSRHSFKHCIVGQVLSDLGISDDDLSAENKNTIDQAVLLKAQIANRFPWLDVEELSRAQLAFDIGAFRAENFTPE